MQLVNTNLIILMNDFLFSDSEHQLAEHNFFLACQSCRNSPKRS